MKKSIFTTLLFLCYANFSCIQEEEYIRNEEQSTTLSPDIYFKSLYMAQTQAFETLYKEKTLIFLSVKK